MDLVHSHYARFGILTQRLLAALRDAGLTSSALRCGDLAFLEQFHVGGRQASEELAGFLSPKPGGSVLDVGSGLGGAARLLAEEYDCQVIGLDLTEACCQAASSLGRETGLHGAARFLCGNALSLPFADQSFDAIWCQHLAMNVADKSQLCREFTRVLKPGGKLAINEILAGLSGDLHFPLPWTPEPRWNHLLTAAAFKHQLEDAGFTSLVWQDRSEDAKNWNAETQLSPLIEAQQMFGPDFETMSANLRKALDAGVLEVVQAVLRKTGP